MIEGADPHADPVPDSSPLILPPTASPTDADLLRAHVDGDAHAFASLVARHQDRLWAIALRMMRNPEDAADALQDAYISAFRRAATYRGEARVTTWLHRVVVNACLDRLRSLRVRAAEPLPGGSGPGGRTGSGRARSAGGPGAAGPGGRGDGAAESGSARGPGARRHVRLPGGGGGGHPRLCGRHGEEPLRARAGQAGSAARHPGARRWTDGASAGTVLQLAYAGAVRHRRRLHLRRRRDPRADERLGPGVDPGAGAVGDPRRC